MFTLLCGLRLSLRPFLPWKPIERGWLSLLFFHFLIRPVFKKTPRVPRPQRELEARTFIHDETKRRSLQPGTLNDDRIKTSTIDGPRTTGPEPVRLDEAPKSIPPTLVTQDATKRAALQPRGDSLGVVEEDALRGKTFIHKFYGSALIVGNHMIMTGLNNGLHTLEITPNGQLFVDNNRQSVNPTDLIRIKAELEKIQKK